MLLPIRVNLSLHPPVWSPRRHLLDTACHHPTCSQPGADGAGFTLQLWLCPHGFTDALGSEGRSCLHAAAGATLPAVSKVLRTLKHTEDATAEPLSDNMYLLCDMALVIARAIVNTHTPGAAESIGRFPGNVPLPRYMFRQLDARLLTGARMSLPYHCLSLLPACVRQPCIVVTCTRLWRGHGCIPMPRTSLDFASGTHVMYSRHHNEQRCWGGLIVHHGLQCQQSVGAEPQQGWLCAKTGRVKEGSHLPAGFEPQLELLCPNQVLAGPLQKLAEEADRAQEKQRAKEERKGGRTKRRDAGSEAAPRQARSKPVTAAAAAKRARKQPAAGCAAPASAGICMHRLALQPPALLYDTKRHVQRAPQLLFIALTATCCWLFNTVIAAIRSKPGIFATFVMDALCAGKRRRGRQTGRSGARPRSRASWRRPTGRVSHRSWS